MKGSEFIGQLVLANITTKSEADQRAMRLREAGLLSKGGRGPHAPDLSTSDIVNLIIAITVAGKSTQAIDKVNVYRKMETSSKGEITAENFGDALAQIILKPELASCIKKTVICRTWPEAEIIFDNGEKQSFEKQGGIIENGFSINNNFFRNDITIQGLFLHELALMLAPNYIEVLYGDELEEFFEKLNSNT
jgi:hypothetical protein